jgi:hypothetical protein
VTTRESNAAPSRRAARRRDEPAAGAVTMLQELAPHLEVEPDPAFRAATRQRLVAMAAVRTPEPVRPSRLRRLLAARASDAPAGRWRTRATAGLAGAALAVTSLATLVALSTGAQPGDALYGLKRGTEQTQLALAGDSRGQVLLDLARTRLDELGDLDGDAGRAESTLATMDEQTREGAAWLASRALDTSSTAPLDDLSGWAAEQSVQLSAVRAEVPAPAADDVDGSLTLLGEITQRVQALRTDLACPNGPVAAGADRLGPVTAGCLPAASAPGGSPQPAQPAPGGTAPEAAPTPGQGAPVLPPGAPAAPTGAQPVPGTVPSQAPTTAPAPPKATPGGLLPTLPPVLPAPTAPATSAPPSVLNLPLPILPCLSLPILVRAGQC